MTPTITRDPTVSPTPDLYTDPDPTRLPHPWSSTSPPGSGRTTQRTLGEVYRSLEEGEKIITTCVTGVRIIPD